MLKQSQSSVSASPQFGSSLLSLEDLTDKDYQLAEFRLYRDLEDQMKHDIRNYSN